MEPSSDTRQLTIDEAVAVAVLLQNNEQLAEAQELFRRILDIDPEHADGLHAFVERTLDSFATSFESKLERLSYRAPALVAAMIEDAGVEARRQLDVLDAGCGTGLCGAVLAPYARRLIGVDLSEGMPARAKEKGLYDAPEHGELTQYLSANRDTFDLIASADTLVYFGDLDPAVTAAGVLRAGGWLIFTLEHAAGRARTPTTGWS